SVNSSLEPEPSTAGTPDPPLADSDDTYCRSLYIEAKLRNAGVTEEIRRRRRSSKRRAGKALNKSSRDMTKKTLEAYERGDFPHTNPP
ncbi:hypothetical protein, partial [Micromonospora sp. NPDC048830]|uniref:hypothetical protein n=1 Tax=Micromonospora sp. NPDC048830 TaxID=3364257 RepID=UPI003721A642